MLSYVSFSLHLSLTFNGEETKLSSITKTAVPSIRIHSFLLNVFYLLTWLTARSSSRLFFCKVSSRILLDFSSFFVKLMPWTVKACWICLSTVIFLIVPLAVDIGVKFLLAFRLTS